MRADIQAHAPVIDQQISPFAQRRENLRMRHRRAALVAGGLVEIEAEFVATRHLDRPASEGAEPQFRPL